MPTCGPAHACPRGCPPPSGTVRRPKIQSGHTLHYDRIRISSSRRPRAPATPTPCQRTFFLIIPYENSRAYLAISLCFYHSAAGSLSHLSNVAGRQSMPVAFHLVNLDEIDSHAPSARCGYHSRDIIMSIFIFGVVWFARQGRHRPSRVRSLSWIGASADRR
jgi:hypothetical protein